MTNVALAVLSIIFMLFIMNDVIKVLFKFDAFQYAYSWIVSIVNFILNDNEDKK